MTLIVNLKDLPLRATACGMCKGSSSDNTIRVRTTEVLKTPMPELMTQTPAQAVD